MKLIPIAGLAMVAGVAAGVTEAIGWTVVVDFAKNKTPILYEEYVEPENIHSDEENMEKNEQGEKSEDISAREKLIMEAEEFLSGVKSRKDNREEYEKLLTDLDNYLVDIPVGDPLYDVYNRLSDIK